MGWKLPIGQFSRRSRKALKRNDSKRKTNFWIFFCAPNLGPNNVGKVASEFA